MSSQRLYDSQVYATKHNKKNMYPMFPILEHLSKYSTEYNGGQHFPVPI